MGARIRGQEIPEGAEPVSDAGKFIGDGLTTRRPHSAATLKPMSSGLLIAAFSSVDWLAKALKCTEAQAREFKANAQMDFESLMTQVRQAKGS